VNVKAKKTRTKAFLLIFYGIVAVGLGYLIIDNLKFRIDQYIAEYNQTVPEQVGFIIAQQIEEVIAPATADFQLKQYEENKISRVKIRQMLNKIKTDTDIREILLISPDNKIIISTAAELEDSKYKEEDELAHLEARTPRVIQRSVGEYIDELDIIWPVIVNKKFQGHIRAVMDMNRLQSFSQARKVIIWGSGIMLGSLIILALTLGWRSGRTPATESAEENPNSAPVKENPESASAVPQNGEPPASSVFSKLNELYDPTMDLDKSFQKSEERIHSMMRVINQGLLILDFNMHIISSNEYILDLFSIGSSTSAQRKVFELLQKNPRLLEMYRRAKDPLTKQVKQNLSLTLLNGQQINVEVLANPFYNGQNAVGVTFYIKNLGLLKELEQTLQRSMKYGLISQLSSSIGHEIRNPLSSLAIHTEIVDNMVSKSVDDETRLKKIKKSITILNSEVERLQKLIDQFFKLAKSQEISLTFENMNDLMDDIHDLVHQQALEKNVRITKHFSNHLPLVRVSKDQLKQVIINLILNGFDAMPEGGDMAIGTSNKEGYVVISIKDTGCGIPDHVKDNIFDLYFTTKDSGGGIGLAISRKIIEAHEGKLYFESKVGAGTIFYVELPTFQN
jgi:signal transduction histidine kinase